MVVEIVDASFGIAPNVLRLGEVAEPKVQLKNKCSNDR